MRSLIRVLAVSGALMVTCGVASAMGQGDKPAEGAPQAAAGSVGAAAPIEKADIKKAISQIRHAWGIDAPCSGGARCAVYFDSFGSSLTFSDGVPVPLAHQQRLNRSAHACIQEARGALQRGDRALAVQWVMAAYLGEPVTRNWLADHADATLEGLRHFGD